MKTGQDKNGKQDILHHPTLLSLPPFPLPFFQEVKVSYTLIPESIKLQDFKTSERFQRSDTHWSVLQNSLPLTDRKFPNSNIQQMANIYLFDFVPAAPLDLNNFLPSGCLDPSCIYRQQLQHLALNFHFTRLSNLSSSLSSSRDSLRRTGKHPRSFAK